MRRSSRLDLAVLAMAVVSFVIACCGNEKARDTKLAEFRETIVAGSTSDFLEVRHVIMRGSNYAIGRAVGEMAEKLGVRALQLEDTLRNMVQRKYMEQNYPVMYERMRGLADSYGFAVGDSRYDFSSIPEFPSQDLGCSVVYYPASSSENDHDILSRNYDFSLGTASGSFPQKGEMAAMSRPYVFELYPDKGYASISICAFDLLGGVLDGVNSEGLAVAVLVEGEAIRKVGVAPTVGVGMHELESMRYLLDNCKNVEEAKQALLSLKHFYTFIPCHYIIGDRGGKSFIFEFSPQRNGVSIIDGSGPQCITNHLVSGYKSIEEFPKTNETNSYERYKTLYTAIEGGGKFSVDKMKAINASVAFAPTAGESRDYPPTRTIWHALYDLDSGSVNVKFYLRDAVDPANNVRMISEYTDYLKFELEPVSR